MSTDTPKLSPVESIKEESRFLKGTIAEEIADSTDHFNKSNIQLLKFHGTYQQDDRELRTERKKAGCGKAYSMMVRLRIPGGRITSDQILSMLDLCEELGNSTMKITTRQTIQLHGMLKDQSAADHPSDQRDRPVDFGRLRRRQPQHHVLPRQTGRRTSTPRLERLTDELTEAMAPKTPAYHEIWVTDPETGEKTLEGGGQVVEPLYGPTYLPRKFKMGIALPEDNCIDIYTQDIGLLAVVRDDKIIGYNVLVGGGMGTTPGQEATYPALGKRMAFAKPEQVDRCCPSDFEGPARQRKSRRPQDRPHEVPGRQMGRREVPRRGRKVLRRVAGRIAPKMTFTASTTTWAGRSRATESGRTV